MDDAARRRQLAQQALADGLFRDCSWCVFTDSGVQELDCVGQEPVNALYDLASVTKVFTATAVLGVTKAQRLSLDAPLGSFGLPDLLGSQISRQRFAQLTLRKLLTHTSGIQAWYPFYADGRPFWTIMTERLEAPPVIGMVYSDLNYILLREVLCLLTGLAYPKVMERYVSQPLKLRPLCYAPLPNLPVAPGSMDNQIEEGMCRDRNMRFNGFRPHDTMVRGQPNDGNTYYYFHGVSGHAGLFGNVKSVAGLGQFYLTTQDPWYTQALQPQPECEGRCLGFHTGAPFPTGCGHTGFTGTSLWIDRQHGFGMVILANRLMGGGPSGPNLNPFRLAMHQTMLKTGELDHGTESDSHGTAQPTNGAH